MRERLASGDTFVVDFDPKCECGNHATHLLTIHAVDHCTPERPTLTAFACQSCLSMVYGMAAKLLNQPVTTRCWTCMMPFDSLSDVVVHLVPVPKGGANA